MPTEDERAATYRSDQRKGQRATRARWRRLHGSRSAYATRLDNTEALQRDNGWDPTPLLSDREQDTIN
jgi:hypothetical protein